MEENKTLELQIQSSAQKTKQDIENLIKSLKGLESQIGNVGDEVEKATSKGSKSKNTLMDRLGISEKDFNDFSNKSKKVIQNIMNFTQKFALVIQRSEQLNLFNVTFKNLEKDGKQTFSELGKEAIKFQNKINYAFGTDMSETLQYQSLFQSMATNIGLDEKTAAIMSENMTKLSYDLASLYNREAKDVAKAIKSSVYAGMTQPLRQMGAEVSLNSLKPTLEGLGITDRNIRDLNQAERQLLRYISVLEQTKNAHGDMANTINSPSNQLKIFKQQIKETEIAISSLFIGLFAEVMPVVNGVIMTIKELFVALANFLNIEVKDYNSGVATNGDLWDDNEDKIDNNIKKVKELKRQALGFDEINNINENNSNGGGGSYDFGTIDKRLLDSIKGYDNGMNSVKNKANDIKNSLLKFLGFTEELDSETGKMVTKFDHFTGGTLLGIVGGSYLVFSKVKGIYNGVKKIFSLPAKAFGKETEKITKNVKEIEKSKAPTKMENLKQALKGVVEVGIGIGLVVDGFNRLKDGGNSLIGVMELVGGAILTIKGAYDIVKGASALFAAATASDMAIATAGISAVVGVVLAIGLAFSNTKTEGEKFAEKLKEIDDTALQHTKGSIAQITYAQELGNELTNLVDANGNVKKSDETRVSYILNELNDAFQTEYKLINGKITLNGNEINSNKKVIESIKKVADQRKAEAILDAYADKRNEIMLRQNDIKDRANELSVKGTEMTKKERLELIELNKEFENNEVFLKNYSDLSAAAYEGNLEAMQKLSKFFYDDTTESLDKAMNGIITVGEELNKKLPDNKKITVSADVAEARKQYSKLIEDMSKTVTIKINGRVINTAAYTKAKGGVFSGGNWSNIPQYASGGIPNRGSMFVAGENGSEIVGNINGRTEVLNKSQIASSIYQAVASAMSEYGGNGIAEINVHASKDVIVETAINGINARTKQTGECPVIL